MLLKGHQSEVAQNEKNASFCRIIRKDQGRIDWVEEDAQTIERKLRAFTPWPGFTALVLMEKGFSCWNLKWLMRIRNPVMSSRV